jgi:hypothetical protein
MHKANLSLESKIENTLYSIYFIGFFIFNALSFFLYHFPTVNNADEGGRDIINSP